MSQPQNCILIWARQYLILVQTSRLTTEHPSKYKKKEKKKNVKTKESFTGISSLSIFQALKLKKRCLHGWISQQKNKPHTCHHSIMNTPDLFEIT